ncbi:D-amino acid dehydrogenase [Komagataeibacter diospyri]|uniref:D-amino acid dehydrogenase small subunit n=1 Tax=Komagataeibacter diospyri TaxID=1932662 RepID=A0A4P5PBI8_9PROT|nr:D-amino acid dehydrogenase [Komagataeibacter diospyri]GCE83731.1 D-amino acid dehydrogenase small subunit [Komagataeibacter diospyri]GCE90630.1 D-amino acid dehydrogenase small subunit [Komagataeibacter diospyri]
MKVIVLGAGVVGVTAAWYLARAGHEVTVVDRQPAAALETSFANAGQISPGFSAPWAEPALPLKVLRWMASRHAPIVIRPRIDFAMMRWIEQLLANCNAHDYDINKSRMLRIAEYSRDCLDALRRDTGITYDDEQRGLIQLFRTQKQVDHAARDMSLLDQAGIAHEFLSPDEIAKHEPGLMENRHLFKGGLRLPGDESGDCHMFTRRLAQKAEEELGVTFHYETTIEALDASATDILGVRTSAGRMTADTYVVSMGSYSPLLLRPLGLHLPVYPTKGYSLTLPVTDAARAPVSTVNDATYKVSITRLGDRIRIGGTAELAGYNLRLRRDRRKLLELSFSELFGASGDLSQGAYWTGLRPSTPDGTPVIGPAGRFSNLWLNTGHGTLGWTMACGSGRVLADRMSGKRTEIPCLDLSLDRYTTV